MSKFCEGDTVRGSFPVETADLQTRTVSQITLADHHSVVVAVMGNTLLLAYAGTDDDPANSKRPGFISFPGSVDSCAMAGWKFGGKYYVDAGRLAFVPANRVTKVGRFSNKLLSAVKTKAGSVRQNPLTYNAKSPELVTGFRRQSKEQKAYA